MARISERYADKIDGVLGWSMAEEVKTPRGILLGSGPGSVSPEGALETYRTFYPGKLENIEQAIVKDWPHDRC